VARVNAGSVDEDEDQRGLAHYDEHMAFNGTKRFPKDHLGEFTCSRSASVRRPISTRTRRGSRPSISSRFRPDKPSSIDKGFNILRDWAGDVTYDPEEVKKESGVVLEEWRLGRGAGMPPVRQARPRAVQGLALCRSHHDRASGDDQGRQPRRARPLLQGLVSPRQHGGEIVVGEIEPGDIENEIKGAVRRSQNPVNERKRVAGGVPKADGTRISIETRQELADHERRRREPRRASLEFDREGLSGASSSSRSTRTSRTTRLAQLRRKAEAPFVGAFHSIGEEVREIRHVLAQRGRSRTARPGGAARAPDRDTAHRSATASRSAELESREGRSWRVGADESADKEATADDRAYTDEITRNFFTKELMIGPRGRARSDEEVTCRSSPSRKLNGLREELRRRREPRRHDLRARGSAGHQGRARQADHREVEEVRHPGVGREADSRRR